MKCCEEVHYVVLGRKLDCRTACRFHPKNTSAGLLHNFVVFPDAFSCIWRSNFYSRRMRESVEVFKEDLWKTCEDVQASACYSDAIIFWLYCYRRKQKFEIMSRWNSHLIRHVHRFRGRSLFVCFNLLAFWSINLFAELVSFRWANCSYVIYQTEASL